jgi:hypothetical protein
MRINMNLAWLLLLMKASKWYISRSPCLFVQAEGIKAYTFLSSSQFTFFSLLSRSHISLRRSCSCFIHSSLGPFSQKTLFTVCAVLAERRGNSAEFRLNSSPFFISLSLTRVRCCDERKWRKWTKNSAANLFFLNYFFHHDERARGEDNYTVWVLKGGLESRD